MYIYNSNLLIFKLFLLMLCFIIEVFRSPIFLLHGVTLLMAFADKYFSPTQIGYLMLKPTDLFRVSKHIWLLLATWFGDFLQIRYLNICKKCYPFWKYFRYDEPFISNLGFISLDTLFTSVIKFWLFTLCIISSILVQFWSGV